MFVMSVSKAVVLKLYRDMMKEAKKFPAYNFRSYALRRIKDGFSENRTLTDPEKIKSKYNLALSNFEILKRQVIVATLFKTDNIVVENKEQNKSLK